MRTGGKAPSRSSWPARLISSIRTPSSMPTSLPKTDRCPRHSLCTLTCAPSFPCPPNVGVSIRCPSLERTRSLPRRKQATKKSKMFEGEEERDRKNSRPTTSPAVTTARERRNSVEIPPIASANDPLPRAGRGDKKGLRDITVRSLFVCRTVNQS